MPDRTWYPYAPDQGFGARLAADEELLDRTLAGLDAHRPAPPVAANTAPRRDAVTSPAVWLHLGSAIDGPVTTASALDAAPFMRSTDG
jgi:hypothetical protein